MADIDWRSPPQPSVFAEITLKKKHLDHPEPGFLDPRMLVVRPKPESKKAAALSLDDVLYYVREAALKYPAFRAKLDQMMASLPPAPAPIKRYDHKPIYEYSDFGSDPGRKCVICGEDHPEELDEDAVAGIMKELSNG